MLLLDKGTCSAAAAASTNDVKWLKASLSILLFGVSSTWLISDAILFDDLNGWNDDDDDDDDNDNDEGTLRDDGIDEEEEVGCEK